MPAVRRMLMAAAFAASSAATCAASPPTVAGVPAVSEAVATFEELARASEARGSLPRLADPSVRPVLQAIWNVAIVAPAGGPGRPGGLALVRLCDAGTRTMTRYIRFRLRDGQDPSVAGNFMIYRPEIMKGIGFFVHCQCALLEAADRAVRALPPEQVTDGVRVDLDESRHRLLVNLAMVLRLFNEGYLPADSLPAVAAALRANGARLAGSLPVAERGELAGMARIVAAGAAPDARADLDALIAVLTEP